ncbi:hypothetical protein E4N62_12365 [Streptomyces sp. MNU76]|uniref:hypothetical protein n=1 Tax=Streptomyces sp. MNU76 TaxID=2560026 RepID=UPI001E4CC48D|nr:hypothetical protein [Streptomyces sp. MNU76]MCC9705978.1 hypothetical protein [Streptomyces sp. MNU76]
MPRTGRFLDIHRDPHSNELLARGGDSQAHSILQRAGFVAVVRLHETYHRTPTGLSVDDESRLATDAVARLRATEYHVDCAPDFDTDARPASYMPLGSSVAHLAERLRDATTTDEAADALTELTAAHDGILAALEEALTATADFHDGLGQPADPYTARRLRYLADEHLHIIRTDLAHTRNALADRHAPHPCRSTCTGISPPPNANAPPCAPARPAAHAPGPAAPVAAGLRR